MKTERVETVPFVASFDSCAHLHADASVAKAFYFSVNAKVDDHF